MICASNKAALHPFAQVDVLLLHLHAMVHRQVAKLACPSEEDGCGHEGPTTRERCRTDDNLKTGML